MKTRVTVKVRTGAPVTKFAGEYGEGWKLQVAAPPVDGKANAAVCALMASATGVPKSAVSVVRGSTSRDKRVRIAGDVDERAVRAELGLD